MTRWKQQYKNRIREQDPLKQGLKQVQWTYLQRVLQQFASKIH